MKKYLRYAFAAVIAGIVIYMVYTHDCFSRKGLDTWLVGQTGEDHYPDWEENMEVTEIDRNILHSDHLSLSRVYLIKHVDSYQLRFRIAYSIPFLHNSLFEDTEWIKLTDSNGNDYFDCLTVYPSEGAGRNCIDVALVMDRDTFSAMSGGKLTVSAVCAEDAENVYANCEAEIMIPGID